MVASYRFNRWIIGAEASFEVWLDTENDENVSYQDHWIYTLFGQVALGDQAPFARPRSVMLRGGLSYQTGYLEIDGTTSDELIFSSGISIPYRYGKNHIDLSYSYHLRGTQSNGL